MNVHTTNVFGSFAEILQLANEYRLLHNIPCDLEAVPLLPPNSDITNLDDDHLFDVESLNAFWSLFVPVTDPMSLTIPLKGIHLLRPPPHTVASVDTYCVICLTPLLKHPITAIGGGYILHKTAMTPMGRYILRLPICSGYCRDQWTEQVVQFRLRKCNIRV